MARIIQVTKVEDTRLWRILSKQKDQDARHLAANVSALCNEAIDRMKAMYAYAPQYTLHDDRHLLRTTELMSLVMGTTTERLNVIELTLLILSAFFHDQGMVLLEKEVSSLDANEDFQLFQNNWRIEHPNYRETAAQMISPICAEAHKIQLAGQIAELDAAMVTDYIRETHGKRSGEFIRSSYGSDKRIEVHNVNLAPFLATICESHTLPSDAMNPRKGFHFDEQVGTYTVNLPFLAVVLRLADILDFDRDRTPEVLLKSIHFTSPVSLHEWEKHRSVEGWQISPDLIRFTVKCKHPAYEATVREYMDWIDKELTYSKQVCQQQPREIKGYQLNLPTNVDRSRIEPLDDAYQFHNLEFSLSRDEVVRLLMTDKLYGKEHLCIRELLQNSLDALRYRKALFSNTGIQWIEGKVEFWHYVNADGYEVLECTDNGSGMDEEIIKNHFVRVGRSFYRSPFFERERNRLKTSGNDFDPCSQFGIGFMSCFMIGDRITIKTRRDYGAGKDYGPPLIVEIHGLSSILIVKQGSSDQPIGTTVSIVSRQKPSFLDSWTDRIKLCIVLKGYALATEFPIIGHSDVPELKETITIPSTVEITPTLLEDASIQNQKSFHIDLSQVSSCLGGFVRESFLIDNTGLPCLENSEAHWFGKTEGSGKKWYLEFLPIGHIIVDKYYEKNVPVCMDGILVAGPPGRSSYREEVSYKLGVRYAQIYSHPRALIDARGDLKPEITPGRVPPDHLGLEQLPGWQRLKNSFKQGLGLLWGNLADYLQRGLSPEIFWKIVVIYDISVAWIPHNTLWETLSILLTNDSDKSTWSLVRDIGEISISGDSNKAFFLKDKQGLKVGPNAELDAWEKEGEERPKLGWEMNSTVLLMSCLDVRDKKVTLTPSLPSNLKVNIAQYAESSHIGVSMFLIEYVGNAFDALTVQTPFPTANRVHPIAITYHQSHYVSEPTDLQAFARAFLPCISESISMRKPSPSLDEPGYWQKRVGHLYFSVRWDHYDASLRPPYKLWLEDRGWFLFQEEDFAKWRDAEVSIDK